MVLYILFYLIVCFNLLSQKFIFAHKHNHIDRFESYLLNNPIKYNHNGRHLSDLKNDQSELNYENTRPIRFHIDTTNLYESTSKKYVNCFREGEWFKWNNPSIDPILTGSELTQSDLICDRSRPRHDQNCWSKCEKSDIIDDDKRDFLIRNVKKQVLEFEQYFRTIKTDQLLKFIYSTGIYNDFHKDLRIECMADCSKGANLYINSTYCEKGIDADVILFLRIMIAENQVGGYGGYCNTELSDNEVIRTNAAYIEINVPNTQYDRDLYESSGFIDRLIKHEILHSLGFGMNRFQSKPGFIQMEFIDDEMVYTIASGKPLTFAKDYFNCPSLRYLPLMGQNQLGQSSIGSHWETRIMADDVLTYSNNGIVSHITLSVFEELGLYLVNYTNINCMHWGAGRGCDFVYNRCMTRSNDYLINITNPNTECGRKSFLSYTDWTKDSFMKSKCGSFSCSNAYMIRNGKIGCNSECAISSDEKTCPKSYVSKPIVQIKKTLKDRIMSMNKYVVGSLLIGLPIIFMLAISFFTNRYLSIRIDHLIIFIMFVLLIFGLGLFGFLIYMMYLEIIDIIYSLIVAVGFFIGVIIVGLIMNISKSIQSKSESAKSDQTIQFNQSVQRSITKVIIPPLKLKKPKQSKSNYKNMGLFIYICLMVLFVLFQLGMSIYLVDYLTGLDELIDKTSRYGGSGKYLDSYMCSVYRNCCNPYFDLIDKSKYTNQTQIQTQCIISHEGNINPLDILNDPSNNGFCLALTGYKIGSKISSRTCNFMESRGIFNRLECKNSFCSLGVGGYLSFLLQGVSYLQRNIYPISSLFSFMLSMQIILIILMVYNMHNKKEDKAIRTKTLKINPNNETNDKNNMS